MSWADLHSPERPQTSAPYPENSVKNHSNTPENPPTSFPRYKYDHEYSYGDRYQRPAQPQVPMVRHSFDENIPVNHVNEGNVPDVASSGMFKYSRECESSNVVYLGPSDRPVFRLPEPSSTSSTANFDTSGYNPTMHQEKSTGNVSLGLIPDNASALSHDSHLGIFGPTHPSNMARLRATNTATSSHPNNPIIIQKSSQREPHTDPTVSISTEFQYIQGAQHAFTNLIPLLNTVNPFTFCVYLLAALKRYNSHVPLDDLFNMIYNPHSTITHSIYNRGFTPQKREGLAFFELILETFKNPQMIRDTRVQNVQLSKINFHEVSRTFLALKIICSCVRPVENPYSELHTIPRSSVYNAYIILCLKLVEKYPTFSRSLQLQNHIILGQSKLGKLVHLVFPDVNIKRLGRRGNSKAHYIGLEWDDTIVGSEMLRLLGMEITEITHHFERSSGKSTKLTKPQSGKRGTNCPTSSTAVSSITNSSFLAPTTIPTSSIPTAPLTLTSRSVSGSFPKLSLNTFVDLSFTYPNFDCSPRVWRTSPNSVPKPSKWANGIMENSMSVLINHNIHLDPLISDINAGVFSEDGPNSLSEVVRLTLHQLSGQSSPEKTFLHFYLVLILLLLPAIVASDQEISPSHKVLLRASINKCVSDLEGETSVSAPGRHVRTFTRILRRMVHLNNMASTSIKITHTGRIFKEIVRGIQFQATRFDPHSTGEISEMEKIVIRGAVMACHAYNFEMTQPSSATPGINSVEAIRNVAKAIRIVSLMATDTMQQTPLFSKIDEEVGKDVPHQMFNLSAAFFHEVTLNYPCISCLPIPIITYIMLHFTREMSNSSLVESNSQGPDLSTETFKCWGVFSSMFQEYMCLLSEVVSLSQKLG